MNALLEAARPYVEAPVTDPNPLSQNQIEDEGWRLLKLLADRSDELIAVSEQAAHADFAYKRANAEAWTRQRGHKGIKDEKEAVVLMETQSFLNDKITLEAKRDALKLVCQNLRTQLEWLRSMNVNARERTVYATGRGA